MFKKLRYFPSAITLLKITKNWYDIPFLVLGIKNTLFLKNGLVFEIVDYMNLLQVVEIIENEDYFIKLKDPKIIIDIGANIGDSAIYFAKKYPHSKIYAFEPVRKTYETLLRNLNVNKIQNVEAINVGVAGESGVQRFYSNKLSGMSGFTKSDAGVKKLNIRTTTLAEFYKNRKIVNVDLIKMDCEGAEFGIFSKIRPKTLRKAKKYVIEYHNNLSSKNHSDLLKLLHTHGYKTKVYKHRIEKEIGIIKTTI